MGRVLGVPRNRLISGPPPTNLTHTRDDPLRGVLRRFELEYGVMEERDFFDESETLKCANLNCLHCHQSETYEIRWLVRTKKKVLRGGADERDRARFANARSYMLRRDDVMQCKNPRCKKRFEISGLQSVVFI